MTGTTLQSIVWALIRAQHGVISRVQLVELGFTRHAIEHRIRIGRLYPIYRGVYAVGRPELTRFGRWMAARLATGPSAFLSHFSAAALWGLRAEAQTIEVSMPLATARERNGITIHAEPRSPPRPVTTSRSPP
jgi:hypothetical protein